MVKMPFRFMMFKIWGRGGGVKPVAMLKFALEFNLWIQLLSGFCKVAQSHSR